MAIRSALIGLLVLILPVNGCGPKGASRPVPPPNAGALGSPCLVGEAAGLVRGMITVSVSGAVDLRRAPIPANDSERILYRQVYETLVDVDCTGTLRKGLAGEWRRRAEGRIWEFTLRPGARFSDGTAVSAQDVKDAWIAGVGKSGPFLAPLWAWVRPESLTVTGAGRLRVSLDRPREDALQIFAHPALAVAKPAPEDPAPLGTGPYVVTESARDTIVCEPNLMNPNPGYSPLRVVVEPGADARDLIGGGGDAVVVREREALNYAADVPGARIIPLTWDRLYILVSSHLDVDRPGWTWRTGLHDLRGELATDIAVSEAREAVAFAFGPGHAAACSFQARYGVTARAQPDTERASDVVYTSGDPDAERLASRLVALEDPEDSTAAGLPRLEARTTPVGVELPGGRFLASLIQGGEWMYVVGLRHDFPDPCLDTELLLDRVPWIRCLAGGCDGSSASLHADDLEQAAVPLIVTRPSLVCRKALAGVELGWDGIPMFRDAGWSDRRGVP